MSHLLRRSQYSSLKSTGICSAHRSSVSLRGNILRGECFQRRYHSTGGAHSSQARSPLLGRFLVQNSGLSLARYRLALSVALLASSGYYAYENYQPFRYTVLAVIRCSRVADAAIRGIIDYKWTFNKAYSSQEEEFQAQSDCHTRSARRILKALLANGGVFIKLGQHVSSLAMLPVEWTSTMRPLQDRCDSTPMDDVRNMFISDLGQQLDDMFEEFDPIPLGTASLAQVHRAKLRGSGQLVAVKLQHPHLREFCDVDMRMVEVSLGWVKYWFPSFEFTWLGEEMRENLPKEMDFRVEAANAQRAVADFADRKWTSLYIPEVISAAQRVLIMEYIQGGRVDDLAYLNKHGINRNKVAIELSRIFNEMVFINGFFHADPHPGNLLIRPAPPSSRSPYNFEVVLLDHGLYFDLDADLRLNYAKFLLSLARPSSPEVNADRRKYAQLMGNIGPDLYPVFEAAITGRAGLEGAWDEDEGQLKNYHRASSLIDQMPQTVEEMEAIRQAVVQREGLLLSVFQVLRMVPRRVLMLLKLNDLTRNLDYALATTHSNIRVFLITAKYCTKAVWMNERQKLITGSSIFSLFLVKYAWAWLKFEFAYQSIRIFEMRLDFIGWWRRQATMFKTLPAGGIDGAKRATIGLA